MHVVESQVIEVLNFFKIFYVNSEFSWLNIWFTSFLLGFLWVLSRGGFFSVHDFILIILEDGNLSEDHEELKVRSPFLKFWLKLKTVQIGDFSSF